ncbi:MAG TPA: molybdopterin cofactor-binding domain-containing protein [Steroidobacteraceae bacterium]|nr:molybdopterin cofactor-binding domain-containing protein [Steroidobacteraceae bacterium]
MITRRRVLIATAGVAGALVVGYAFWPDERLTVADRLDARPGERFLSTWIKVGQDDFVTVVIPHCEMGTGITTALAQMAAEELDADWSRVRAEIAPADAAFANGALAEGFLLDSRDLTLDSIPTFLRGAAADATGRIARYMDLQTTGGSSAVRATGVYGIRVAAAAARDLLVRAAAARLNAPRDSFHTAKSRVIHASGQSFGFGELAPEAADYRPSAHPVLKERNAYTLVGAPLARFDVPSKVNGSTTYGIDTSLPDLCYAAIRIAPTAGGKLRSVDEATASGMRGVHRIVRLDHAVVVVADRFWRAQRALDALAPVFDAGPHAAVSSSSLRERQIAALGSNRAETDITVGRGADALGGHVVERLYQVPYLAHAALEPVNATALYRPSGALEVWAGSQDGLGARAFCAKVAGLHVDQVAFHQLPSGGAFGRRLPGAWNFLEYAVRTAMAVPGVPIKLIFTREEDIRHDYYRPSVASRFRGSLGADGTPRVWVNEYTTVDDAADEAHIVYGVPHQAYKAVKVASPVPTGSWRSVESSWHGFFVESFVDELAHEARRDPLEYRRALLAQKPRHLAVLNLAAEKAGWNAPLTPRVGRGIALVECFGTIVAQVAEVEVGDAASVRVRRVTCAADCGMVVNPDGFRAQVEGGIIFGLSAALYGAITLDRGAVVQQNFPDYPVVHLADCPDIEVHTIESGDRIGGAGEVGVPPVAPALANAIFAATGVRVRELPVVRGATTPG